MKSILTLLSVIANAPAVDAPIKARAVYLHLKLSCSDVLSSIFGGR
jgi:hypothetical protein